MKSSGIFTFLSTSQYLPLLSTRSSKPPYFFHKLKKLTALGVFATVLFVPGLSQAEENAIDLLNKMNQALHNLTYKGTLVLIQGNKVSSLKVEQSVENGVRAERVVRLNETGSEISREIKGFSLSNIPTIRPEMEKVYSFDLGRENKVANIPCRIITARPKDRKRYLQKYCIDVESGMLLDYRLVGKTHKPVEQFMFTNIDIRMPDLINAASVKADPSATKVILDTEGVSQITAISPVEITQDSNMSPEVESLLREISNASLEDGWYVEALPAGYEIMQAPHLQEEVDEKTHKKSVTKHYVVSDGLSSLSLFFTPLTVDNQSEEAIEIRSGALNIVTQNKNGHRITAVGDVPEVTLKTIVQNLQHKP